MTLTLQFAALVAIFVVAWGTLCYVLGVVSMYFYLSFSILFSGHRKKGSRQTVAVTFQRCRIVRSSTSRLGLAYCEVYSRAMVHVGNIHACCVLTYTYRNVFVFRLQYITFSSRGDAS